MMYKSKYTVLILILILGIVFHSCKPPEKTPPLQPDNESLELDLSFFQIGQGGDYYNYASSKVNYWQVLLSDSLNLQRTLYNSVVDIDPVYQSGNTWLSKAETEYNDQNYEVDLFMSDYSDSLEYKLYFSLFPADADTFLHLLIYDGKSYQDNAYGNWTINKPDTANTYDEFLQIIWTDTVGSLNSIRFTNTLEGNANGSYILYLDSIEDDFNSYLDLFDKELENHTIIQWNSLTNTGRIKDNLEFPDDQWYYWDGSLNDMAK